MRNAWVPTGLMGMMAATLGLIASFLYPWPDRVVTNIQANQKLFADLDINQVRTLTITAFDRENRRFESIQLRRIRDTWEVTTSGDYPAGNTKRIADVFTVLSESQILEVKSSDDSTHQLYGVVDADQASDAANQTGIGTKVSLADNNNRTVAELLIGESLGENTNQHFVRIAGQPNVYVVQLSTSLLSTSLADWVDRNLLDLKLTESGGGMDVRGVTIDHYVLEGESVSADSLQKYNYQAKINFSDKSVPLSISKPGDDGKLGQPKTGKKVNPQTLSRLASNLSQIQFFAVGKKPPAASQALAEGLAEGGDLKSLLNFGFRRGNSTDNWLESKNGQVAVTTGAGVDWTLNFGSVAVNSSVADTRINYYLIITARANESAFPLPDEPKDKENEDQKKEYERALKRRDDSLAAAQTLAKQYNARHAPWLYLISEDAFEALHPDESKLIQ